MGKTILEFMEENKKLKGRLQAVDNVLKEQKTNVTDKVIKISRVVRDTTREYREG